MRRLRILAIVFSSLAVAVGGLVLPAASPAQAVSCRISQVLRHNDRGDEVLCLERRLLELGFMDRYVDTFYGSSTRDAVKSFQRSRGLRQSGDVNHPTAKALKIGISRYVPTHRPIERRRIGYSVNGYAIWAYRYGTPGGTKVLAVGQIHGNEPGGAGIAAFLRVNGAPRGIDMWVVDSMNPEGWRRQSRTNARGVDLNRNFNSGNWVYSGAGTSSYSGPSAASEPETRAMQTFLDSVRPRVTIVYHQVGRHVDDNRSVANYNLLRQYSALTDFPIRTTCTRCGGTLTSYMNLRYPNATAFTVEMPRDFKYKMARRHGKAFLAIGASS